MIGITETCRGANASRAKVVTAAALALAFLPAARARAGVEYVTSTGDCTTHIGGPSAALPVRAGPGRQFEVWGNSVDLAPTIKFGGALTGATIVARHSGPDNASRGCGFVGSMVVSVSSNVAITANAAASVSFQMPLGDFSSQALTVVAFPALAQPTWTTNGSLQPSNLPCIVKTGSITTINQDTKLVIQLPPGASQDQTTCTSNVINVHVQPATASQIVSDPTFNYTVAGAPAFVTVHQVAPENAGHLATLSFTFNVAGIRALTTTSTSTITITNPIVTARTATITLQVSPSTVAQGFAAPASAIPSSTTAGNPIDFTLKFSAPTRSGQVITWRMTQAGCFVSADSTQWPYDPRTSTGFQYFRAPTNVTSTVIRVLSQNNSGCTSKLAPTTQIFEAWLGDQRVSPNIVNVTSGPTYTRVNISLLFP
ncbi:MAG TPA: hypothetical protein VL524_06270 [Gemmatimonadaceae bacterium]|jgi:hypothetical protein|nr:hypothetical protein [Gemmatimonadaceae bacterium]